MTKNSIVNIYFLNSSNVAVLRCWGWNFVCDCARNQDPYVHLVTEFRLFVNLSRCLVANFACCHFDLAAFDFSVASLVNATQQPEQNSYELQLVAILPPLTTTSAQIIHYLYSKKQLKPYFAFANWVLYWGRRKWIKNDCPYRHMIKRYQCTVYADSHFAFISKYSENEIIAEWEWER